MVRDMKKRTPNSKILIILLFPIVILLTLVITRIYSSHQSIKPDRSTVSNSDLTEFKVKLDKEIANYDRAIALNPNDAKAYYERGMAKLSSKEYSLSAITDFDRAIEINPDDNIFYYMRHWPKYRLGQIQAAVIDEDTAYYVAAHYRYPKLSYNKIQQERINHLDREIAINPNDAKAYYDRGRTKAKLGQEEAAINDFDRAIVISPRDEFDIRAETYNCRGLVKSRLGQKVAALNDFDRSIAIDNRDADVYYNRGSVKSLSGQEEAAISDFDRAIMINPKNADAYFRRGHAKFKIGRNEAAISDYDRGIVISPNNAGTYYIRGLIKLELKQKKLTILDLNKAAELYRQQNQMKSYQDVIEAIHEARKLNDAENP
jgi:tetratricopeptide (TPR) repeat protein